MSWIDDLADAHDHEILRLDGFDDCCVGLVARAGMDPVLLYDRAAMVERLVEAGASPEAAEAHVTEIGVWAGDGTPAFLVERAPSEA